MTVQEVTYFVAECDLCGYRDDEGDYSAWGAAEMAEEAVRDADWLTEKGNLICPECLDDLTTPPSDDEQH